LATLLITVFAIFAGRHLVRRYRLTHDVGS
jgi:hypothetical protein